ncbi:MAG: hypothetical protein QM687_13680 [Ferruginibacter sp.]
MKRLIIALLVLVTAASVTSCRTSKYGCPANNMATSQNQKAIKA